jgi:hypothetical protein
MNFIFGHTLNVCLSHGILYINIKAVLESNA